MGNGKGKIKDIIPGEHPKNQIEIMSNTMDAITGYASAKQLSMPEAALVLILNELRCIHWHMDVMMAEKEEVKANNEKDNTRQD
ncbi:hypothetical protein ES703_71937 [subsurface metagenome]